MEKGDDILTLTIMIYLRLILKNNIILLKYNILL